MYNNLYVVIYDINGTIELPAKYYLIK